MKAQCLITLLLVCCAWKNADALTCYVCSSTIGNDGVEVNNPTADTGSCASLSGKTVPATSNDFGCQTTFSSSGGVTTITRGPLGAATTTPGCTSSGASGVTCTCTTDKCNSHAVAAAQAYTCYECQSSPYFDNGCGEKLNSGSAYVRQVKGCSVCYKNVGMSSDHSVQYSRGCTRSVDVDANCNGDESSVIGRTCGCKGALCNSADTLAIKSTTAFTAVVLTAIVRLMC